MTNAPAYQDEEEMYQQMLDAGKANAQYQSTMDAQKAMAERLRDTSGDQRGQMISGHYVAASPLDQIARGVKNYQANGADAAGATAATGLNDSQSSQSNMILQAMLRNRNGGGMGGGYSPSDMRPRGGM